MYCRQPESRRPQVRKLVSSVVVSLFLAGILSAQEQQPSSPQLQPPPQARSEESKPKQSSAPAKDKHTRVVTNLAGFDLLEAGKLSGQTMVVGATRGMTQPAALAPRLAKLYGANPTFVWSYTGTAARFVFVLTDDAHREVYRAEVSGTQFRYPAGAPALQPGKIYFWTVTTPDSVAGSISSDSSGVSVVSPTQRQEIDKSLTGFPGDSYAAGLARAQVFTDYRLWYDALAAFTELIDRFPDRAELYELRGTIYAQLKCTQALSEADFSRAEKAQREKE
jgi:hypothetical protein